MKINITGASGSGSTTLGRSLAKNLSIPYFDSDNYFWEPSEQPFTIKRDRDLRNKMLIDDLKLHENWILSGSVIHWDDSFLNMFNLVVFLYLPADIRIKRLKEREFELYGDIIYTDPRRIALYNAFISWASGYDDNSVNGRTLQAHETWLKKLSCPVLEIRGDTSVKERIQLVLNKINTA